MNYEFEIRKLDEELRHMREMQAIYRECVEAHETGPGYTGTRLAAIEAALETLTNNVSTLVTALLREHPNGNCLEPPRSSSRLLYSREAGQRLLRDPARR